MSPMWIRFVVLLSCVVGISEASGCGRDPGHAVVVPDQFAAIEEPEQLTLYSIDGTELPREREQRTGEKFHSYPVLGKLEVTDARMRKEIFSALMSAIAGGNGKFPNCY